jgi:hypothetical protein
MMTQSIPLTSDLTGMAQFVDEASALLRRGQRDHDLTENEFSFLAALWSRLNTPLSQYAARCFKAQDEGKPPDPAVLSIYRKLATFVGEVAPLHRELEKAGEWNTLLSEIAQHGSFQNGSPNENQS